MRKSTVEEVSTTDKNNSKLLLNSIAIEFIKKDVHVYHTYYPVESSYVEENMSHFYNFSQHVNNNAFEYLI